MKWLDLNSGLYRKGVPADLEGWFPAPPGQPAHQDGEPSGALQAEEPPSPAGADRISTFCSLEASLDFQNGAVTQLRLSFQQQNVSKCRNVLTDSSSGIFLAGNFPPVCVCTRTAASANAEAEAPLPSKRGSANVTDVCPCITAVCRNLIRSPAVFTGLTRMFFMRFFGTPCPPHRFKRCFVFILLVETESRVVADAVVQRWGTAADLQ